MNIVLAVSIIITLSCVLYVRVTCLLAIYNNVKVNDKLQNCALLIGTLSFIVFIIEFLFNSFNIIL